LLLQKTKTKQRGGKSETEIHTWQTFVAALWAFHVAPVQTADDCPLWPAASLHTASLLPASLVLDSTPVSTTHRQVHTDTHTHKKAKEIWKNLHVANAIVRWQHKHELVAKHFTKRPLMPPCKFGLKFFYSRGSLTQCGKGLYQSATQSVHNISMWRTNQLKTLATSRCQLTHWV